MCAKAYIRLEIEIELVFNQSEERKPISSLVNFALIGQNPIQSQYQSLVWSGLNGTLPVSLTDVGEIGP